MKRVYIITSEGGAGHKTAMQDSHARYLVENPECTIDIEYVMPPILSNEVIKASKQGGHQVKQQKSWMTLFFGLIDVGLWGTKQWNEAQSKGDIKKTKSLVARQWMSELFFGRAFKNNVLQHLQMHPDTELVVDTQAQNTHQILSAVAQFNRQNNKQIRFLKRMTDLPNKAEHFFLSLNKIEAKDLEYLDLEVPHAPGVPKEDTAGNVAYYQTKCPNLFDDKGKPKCQFIFTDGPIKKPFKDILEARKDAQRLEALVPRKSEMTLPITVKNPDNPKSDPITVSQKIPANAKVKSIMLGSQAAAPATLAYVDAEIELYPQTTPDQGPCYVFVFCGNNADLFAQVQAKSDAAHTQYPNLHIVPLINQEAAMIAKVYARSDTIILRAGGVSCMEVEATAHPGAEIFFHAEGQGGTQKELAKALVSWEAGNVAHVQQSLKKNNNKVRLTTPALYKAAAQRKMAKKPSRAASMSVFESLGSLSPLSNSQSSELKKSSHAAQNPNEAVKKKTKKKK